jgi:hypothetical protein
MVNHILGMVDTIRETVNPLRKMVNHIQEMVDTIRETVNPL